MGEKVKIAGVQMEPKILEKERNLGRCLDLMRLTAKDGARLIIFPECALTGYCFASLEEASPLAEPVPGPSTQRLAETCRELGVYVIVGLLENDEDRHFNAAALIGPQGVVGRYRKIHLPYLGVDRFLNHGDRPFSVYETEIGRIGMSICYDANFPESARTMALQGADLIALPTNWPMGREILPAHVIPTRAFENHVYFAAVNRVGEERGFRFIGSSKIADVFGFTLAQGKPDEEGILYAEVDLEAARNKHIVIVPSQFEVDLMGDRRPEFYALITEPLKTPSTRR